MTDQVNLGLSWAATGGVDPVSAAKYSTGWEIEIPTFQNFNYVLQGLDNNLLALAEAGQWNWQADINYKAGAKVREGGVEYTCITDNIGNLPSGDTLFNNWTLGTQFGIDPQGTLEASEGVKIKGVNTVAINTWGGNTITTEATTPLMAFNTSGVTDNWLIGNVAGKMVAVNTGTTKLPDGRSVAMADPSVFQIYHEGNKPTQSDVDGSVEEAPNTGVTFARKNKGWIRVTTTTVSDNVPPPALGNGEGWFNLNDNQLYIDINDGDTSQWVPANSPLIPSELDDVASNVKELTTSEVTAGTGTDTGTITPKQLHDKITAAIPSYSALATGDYTGSGTTAKLISGAVLNAAIDAKLPDAVREITNVEMATAVLTTKGISSPKQIADLIDAKLAALQTGAPTIEYTLPYVLVSNNEEVTFPASESVRVYLNGFIQHYQTMTMSKTGDNFTSLSVTGSIIGDSIIIELINKV